MDAVEEIRDRTERLVRERQQLRGTGAVRCELEANRLELVRAHCARPSMPDSLAALVLIFVAAAVAVWVAGIWLSRMTDVLSVRFHLGEALAGSILLAITTNLPEVAITVTAALEHNIGIATGNIIGGIAI
jgi:Ca2+/H+ antiporter